MIKLNDIKETRIDTSEILCYNLDDGMGKHIFIYFKKFNGEYCLWYYSKELAEKDIAILDSIFLDNCI